MPEVTRRYDDPCGIARALDAVGERWSLLVVRELVFGPKRFSDLRRGLAGISPNVLSQRLSELERDGLLRRRAAGPPISATVYGLTDSGHDLLPVLEALAHWGKHRPILSDRPLSRDALMLALQTTVRPGATVPPGLHLILDGTTWQPTLTDGVLTWQPPAPQPPEATLETTSETLHRLVFRQAPLNPGETTGDVNLIQAFLTAFERPATT